MKISELFKKPWWYAMMAATVVVVSTITLWFMDTENDRIAKSLTWFASSYDVVDYKGDVVGSIHVMFDDQEYKDVTTVQLIVPEGTFNATVVDPIGLFNTLYDIDDGFTTLNQYNHYNRSFKFWR